MKYVLIIVLLALLVPYVMHQMWQNPDAKVVIQQKTNEKETVFKQIDFKGQVYLFDYFVTTPANSFKMINNVKENSSSQTLIEEKSCQYLANAGFYDKSLENIGQLVVDGETLSPYQKNQLFNGMMYASQSGQLLIRRASSDMVFDNGFQTGPILIEDNSAVKLELKNDETERRTVAINTNDNKTIFMILIDQKGKFEGPLLADLPEVIMAIAQQENFTVKDALNLDGGSASVFYNQKNYLKELKTVGTFLCFN